MVIEPVLGEKAWLDEAIRRLKSAISEEKLEHAGIRSTRLRIFVRLPSYYPITDLECDTDMTAKRAVCTVYEDDIEVGAILIDGEDFDRFMDVATKYIFGKRG